MLSFFKLLLTLCCKLLVFYLKNLYALSTGILYFIAVKATFLDLVHDRKTFRLQLHREFFFVKSSVFQADDHSVPPIILYFYKNGNNRKQYQQNHKIKCYIFDRKGYKKKRKQDENKLNCSV